MPNAPRVTKDQGRARLAYKRVAAVASDKREDYKIAVKALGANILRSGLSAALADLMRRNASNVVDDIARFNIPGLRTDLGDAPLFVTVNNLPVGQYMLATRETLQVVMWLKRACEALFEDKEPAAPPVREGGDIHA
jgi:CRISPR-associated protein Cmr5